MEQPDEEKRDVCTRTTRQSLPLDLASIILSKLPAKSVVKFRCVSKLWSSISSDPSYFETRPRLLVIFGEGDKFFFFSLPQHKQNPNTNEAYSYCSSRPVDSYHMRTYPKNSPFTIKTELVHGLIILMICYLNSADLIAWNPTMRRFITIPTPGWGWTNVTFFLGYDPIECKHKLVCMSRDKASNECQVLTLGSVPELWMRMETNHEHCPLTGNSTGRFCGRCINGVLYYPAKLGSDRVVVMRFDVRTEKFDVITLPWGKSWRMMMMIPYEGKLACVGSSKRGKSISMWVLKDATKHEWSNHLYSPLSHYGQDLQDQFKLIGITDDGDLIYAPKTLLKTLDLIYIDPKRETLTRVEFRGTIDDSFRRRHGLGDGPLPGLQFFPNHIETIMS